MKNTPVFSGKSGWRTWDFWLILSFYLGFVVGYRYLYLKEDFIVVLISAPLYILLLLPSRVWIGEHHLFAIGRMKVEYRKFEKIESFEMWESSETITLNLVRVASAKPLRVNFEISRGKELKRFLAEMGQRQVLNSMEKAQQDWKIMMESFQTFSPPYEDTDSEREALYRFLNRPQPESEKSTNS